MSMRTLVNIAVSIVIALGLVFVVRGLAGYLFAVQPPEKPAIPVPVAEEAAPEPEKKAEAPAAEQQQAEAPAAEQPAAQAPAEQQTAQAEAPAEQQAAPAEQQQAAAPAAGEAAAGDPAAGKKVFNKCKACHFADKEKNKVGPYLKGVVGRKAAAVEGFKYSDAMKAKAAEGLVWTEENLKAYLAAPKKFVPGNKMAFVGLKKDKDIADVIAYLKSNQ